MTLPTKEVQIADRTYTVAGVDVSDPYFSAITDNFEPDFQEFCRFFLQSDDVCLDIGANIGMKSLMLSRFVRNGRVIAVEAAPTVGEALTLNIEKSGEPNITVSRCAISDTDGEVGFADNSAYGHIAPSGVRVPAKRLTTLLGEQGVSRLDFIKIDVEGFEYPILKDSLDIINRHKSLVLFEFNSWCQLAFAHVSPLEFARWIVASFSHVFMVRRVQSGGLALERVSPDGSLGLLHTNLVEDRTLTDILVTNAPERWSSSFATLEHRIAASSFYEPSLAAQLAEARAEIERLTLERNALLSSTSWRLSKPLRVAGRILKGRD
ncbi:FkbM family methyltransferase [Microvirga yunnanensis]|uniref:FkbM family methyltransferase n=1 Tax=Microvirga yunnanensis TaxID=2953740 RepID=UPI0021C9E787|nr:FkbM family methyltransferase [Microvirga sp. HBU65207]